MSDKFTFNSAGQMHELELAMDRVGDWDNSLVKKACKGNNLGLFRDFLRGDASIANNITKHVIDCDAAPFKPECGFSFMEVVSHKKGGRQFICDPAKVQAYLSKHQQVGMVGIDGNKLRKELASKPVLNANVLDYWLKNPHLIPKNLKRDMRNGNIRNIFFWGTIYSTSDGRLHVRCLSYYKEMSSGSRCLDNDWGGYDPVALYVD